MIARKMIFIYLVKHKKIVHSKITKHLLFTENCLNYMLYLNK